MAVRSIRALAGALVIATAAPLAAADLEGPITLVVPAGAGGGTDVLARRLALLLREPLGVMVQVVDRPADRGAEGVAAIVGAAPDGATLGLITSTTPVESDRVTPLALLSADAGALHVAADGPWQSAGDLLAAVRAGPARLRATGGAQDGVWQVALARMLEAAGSAPDAVDWLPSRDAAGGFEHLLAGEADLVICSLTEAETFVEAGRVRSLAVLSAARAPRFADVPTLEEAAGVAFAHLAWRGVVAPRGLPERVVGQLVPALKAVHESAAFRTFMAHWGFGPRWLESAEFSRFMAAGEAGSAILPDTPDAAR